MSGRAVGDVLYRAVAHYYGADVKIHYESWAVEKLTPQGAWLRLLSPDGLAMTWGTGTRTWRTGIWFASTTKDDALAHLKRRTLARFRHDKRRIGVTRRIMAKLEIGEPRPRIDLMELDI